MTFRPTLSVMFFLFPSLLFAQDRNAVFEQNTPITWLGLDFTGALLVGDPERLNNDETVYKLMESLNTLMTAEAEKYNIPETFDKVNVENALEITARQNNLIKADALRAESTAGFSGLSPGIIREIASRYNYDGREGMGLMFNVERFDKPAMKGVVWITFIDMKTGNVILTERMEDGPMGFGLRNYWAGCIYGILKQIKKGELKTWKKKYYQG